MNQFIISVSFAECKSFWKYLRKENPPKPVFRKLFLAVIPDLWYTKVNIFVQSAPNRKRESVCIVTMGSVFWISFFPPAASCPVFFKQKRVGLHKSHFHILKFRTMKMNTPHDVPTHLLENPEQYITRVGKFLRKTSLDELPQIFQIFTGKMAVIGPRPALWNQYDLIALREAVGANDVRPGLTGWAQINGRDEIPIEQKAALDGEYVKNLSFLFDCKCFFGSVIAVLKRDGVVEGGTGAKERK